MNSETSQSPTDKLSTDIIEEDIRNTFELPICSANGLCTLDQDIVCDLELVKTVDVNETSVLTRMFGDNNTYNSSQETHDVSSSTQKSLGNIIQDDMAHKGL